MALEPALGSIAHAISTAQDKGPKPQAAPAAFDRFLVAANDAATPTQATATTPQPTTPQPAALQAVRRPGATLGNDVLDTLERFGGKLQDLQKLGSARAAPARAAPVRVAFASQPGLSPTMTDAAPAADPFGSLKQGYEQIFGDSMRHQARLFGLVIEVDLGRSVASTATSTAKTLLTQSG